MTDLSPAAQAVLDAYETSYTESGLVAALRVLAVRINGADAIRQDILDIAEELEAQ